MKLDLEHHYARFPPHFFAEVAPTLVREPSLVWFNEPLATQLGLYGVGRVLNPRAWPRCSQATNCLRMRDP